MYSLSTAIWRWSFSRLQERLGTADQPSSAADRLKYGLTWGLSFGIFTPLILAVPVMAGSWVAMSHRTPVNFGLLAITYPAGAVATGVLFFLLPPQRIRIARVLWGIVSFMPWSLAMGVAVVAAAPAPKTEVRHC